jgi:hypothetical protein
VPVSSKPAALDRRLLASLPIGHDIRVIDDFIRPIGVNAFLHCIDELLLRSDVGLQGIMQQPGFCTAKNGRKLFDLLRQFTADAC